MTNKSKWLIVLSLLGKLHLAQAAEIAANSPVATELPYDEAKGYSLRVKLPATFPTDDAPLAAITDADGEYLFRLRADKTVLYADVYTGIPAKSRVDMLLKKKDPMQKKLLDRLREGKGRMELLVPRDLLDQSRTRELMIVVTPVNIDVYLDGVVVDQEWPAGLRPFKAPLRLDVARGVEAEHSVATPGAKEVTARYGGAGPARAAWEQFFGTTGGLPPHYRPQGMGVHAADTMVLYHDGRFHLYYLRDRRHHQSKWNYGGAGYGHLSTTDLVNWIEHPMVAGVTEPWEGGLQTGCVAHNGNEYIAFYEAYVLADMGAVPGTRTARSKDGINFTKDQRIIPNLIMGDNEVFRMRDGRWGMITRGNHPTIQTGPTDDRTRGFAFFTSPDLLNWTRGESPFEFAPKNCDCPHYFEMGGRSWFFASSTVRTAPALEGPWTDIPDWRNLGIAKTAPWKDGRRLITGTVGSPGGWGGDAILHELVVLPGTRLGEKFIPEMTPLRGEVLQREPRATTGTVDISGNRVTVSGVTGPAAAAIDGIPQMARVRMTIRSNGSGGNFGIILRQNSDSIKGGGSKVIFNPTAKTVSMGEKRLGQIAELDQLISLDIILGSYGLIDIEINKQRCFTFRNTDVLNNRMLLFADGTDVVFEDIAVRPWQPVTTVKRYHAFE